VPALAVTPLIRTQRSDPTARPSLESNCGGNNRPRCCPLLCLLSYSNSRRWRDSNPQPLVRCNPRLHHAAKSSGIDFSLPPSRSKIDPPSLLPSFRYLITSWLPSAHTHSTHPLLPLTPPNSPAINLPGGTSPTGIAFHNLRATTPPEAPEVSVNFTIPGTNSCPLVNPLNLNNLGGFFRVA
jgi:hypothetical protein